MDSFNIIWSSLFTRTPPTSGDISSKPSCFENSLLVEGDQIDELPAIPDETKDQSQFPSFEASDVEESISTRAVAVINSLTPELVNEVNNERVNKFSHGLITETLNLLGAEEKIEKECTEFVRFVVRTADTQCPDMESYLILIYGIGKSVCIYYLY